MSHFFTVVIIPTDKKDPNKEVERLLAPYNEGKRVKGYDEPCYCVKDTLREPRQEVLTATLGNISTMREQHHDLMKRLGVNTSPFGDADTADDKFAQTLWESRIGLYTTLEKAIAERMGEAKVPDSDCTECKGTGVRKSTYNPKSKWDWWSYGGRWNGVIRNSYKGDDKGFNFGDEYRQMDENMLPVADYYELFANPATRDEVRPFAILTPDGKWHQKAEMGWWGMTSDEKEIEDWIDDLFLILDKYREGYIAIGLDLHI